MTIIMDDCSRATTRMFRSLIVRRKELFVRRVNPLDTQQYFLDC